MLLALLSLAFYVAATLLVWRRPLDSMTERLCAFAGVMLHAWALGHQVFRGGGLTIGLAEALSLFTWQAALLLWCLCWREPVRTLGLAVYPLAGAAAVMAGLWPAPTSDIIISDWKTRAHVVLSLLSAGLLTLAAAHALLLAAQERWLHAHRTTHLNRVLPPLQTMERLLFQFIAIGFALLSLTLLSGLWFVRDWLAQHLAHKTVLSISAWLIFGVLLWGRLRHGWRGRTAIRWTLAGYATLILAYFGSKLILEEILGRHWG